MNKLIEITQEVNNFLWTNVGLYLILAVGVLMTILTRFFQVTHIKHWFKNTIGSLLKKDSSSNSKTDKKSISQFQALCTAFQAANNPFLFRRSTGQAKLQQAQTCADKTCAY